MLPLALNSPSWSQLQDAYGSAERIPALIEALERADEGSLDELFGRICHQMSVYSSSIAALPHLIAIASKLDANPDLQAQTLCLAGAICESHEFASALQRSAHSQAALAVLPTAARLAEAALSTTTTETPATYLLKSIASFEHMQALARVLEGFANEEFTLECPSCTIGLYVWPCLEGFSVAAEDPVSYNDTTRTFVSPQPQNHLQSQAEFPWLEQHSSKTSSLLGIHEKLPFLFGTARCPRCGHAFSLFAELAAQAA